MKVFITNCIAIVVFTYIAFSARSQVTFNEVYQKFSLKELPVNDTTNFDNIKLSKELNRSEIEALHLNKIYTQLDSGRYELRFQPSYRIELSKRYFTLVITVFKGDNELESVLITYSEDGDLINYTGIAYDEIAEGWSRKSSSIQNDIITLIDVFYGDNKQVDTTKFHINNFGEFNELATKFYSDLRPGEQLTIDKTYTDKVEFLEYDDNGDYALFIGKKNENVVSLIYDSEVFSNEKYNFKAGDVIEIKWKMDTIFIAGEGEMMSFSERLIDAILAK